MHRTHRWFGPSLLAGALMAALMLSTPATAQVAEATFPLERAKETLTKEFSKRRYKPVRLIGFQTVAPSQVTAYLAFTDEVGTTTVRFNELTTDKGKQWFMHMNDKEQTMLQVD